MSSSSFCLFIVLEVFLSLPTCLWQESHVEEIGGFLRSGSEGLLSASKAVVEVGSGLGFR